MLLYCLLKFFSTTQISPQKVNLINSITKWHILTSERQMNLSFKSLVKFNDKRFSQYVKWKFPFVTIIIAQTKKWPGGRKFSKFWLDSLNFVRYSRNMVQTVLLENYCHSKPKIMYSLKDDYYISAEVDIVKGSIQFCQKLYSNPYI